MKKRTIHTTITIAVIMIMQSGFAQTTWTSQNSGVTDTLRAVTFLDGNNGYVGGNNGTILKTTDGGTTWTDVSLSSTNPVNSLSFINTTTGWACTGDVDSSGSTGEIWATTDGGANWTQQSNTPSTEARLGISFIDASNGWVSGSKNGPMEVWNTTDGGANYSTQGNGNIFGWMYDIEALDANNVWTVGGTFFPSVSGLVVSSSDGGATWTDITSGTPPFLYAIDMVDASNVFVAGDAGTILSTTDGGSNWNTLTSGTTEILWGISFAYLTYGLACGENGAMVSTTDGSTWNSENTGNSESYYGVYMIDSITAWAVGSNGTIIKRIFGTGFEDQQINKPTVKVFPNPFSKQASITVENAITKGNLTFTLFDALGNKVLQNTITGQNFTLNGAELSKGIYHYTLTGNNQNPVFGKLIIQ